MTLKNDISEIVLTEEDIASLAKSLGEQITKDYEGKKPILAAL